MEGDSQKINNILGILFNKNFYTFYKLITAGNKLYNFNIQTHTTAL